MKGFAPLMSSAVTTWCTPPEVLDVVRELGAIGLDPCSNAESIVGAQVAWNRYDDGLSLPWHEHGLAYANPPYGRAISQWVEKCCAEAGRGAEIVALVPARTDTSWWHRHCVPPRSQAVCFWRGRIKFLGAPSPAPFPSALVYYGPRRFQFRDVFSAVGTVWVG